MIIKVDCREKELLAHINQLVLFIPVFKQIKVVTENLPLGDFIIADEKEDKLVIERKSISDLLASIKDGRYEEQSYRLNGLNCHNHNIIYLIEGDVNRVNRFKSDTQIEKLTAYSAMFSLNYFKGFSVFRSFTIEESALIICNMAYKLEKCLVSGKKPFYPPLEKVEPKICSDLEKMEPKICSDLEKVESKICSDLEKVVSKDLAPPFSKVEKVEKDEDYVSVIKKVKKENITPDNIGEIMLCQIPGINSVTALAIMEQYKSLPNLIKEIEMNNECLKNISYTTSKGQSRKINKSSIENIVKFLLKK